MKFSKFSAVLSLLSGSHARELRRAKTSKQDDVAAVDSYADDLCKDYCSDYFESCANWNIYLNPEGKSSSVSGITTQEPDLPRADNLQLLADASAECLKSCMKWPRPIDPVNFISGRNGTYIFNSRSGGDTLWCRQTHLFLAGKDPNNQAFHCGHGTNTALGICRDVLIDDGYTPYELLRDGASTKHRLAFCDVAGEGKIADCTMGGVDNSNLKLVLRSLPSTVEILFLNGNKITELGAQAFSVDALRNPTNLKALYLNDNNSTAIDQNALEGLDNLQVFNADNNQVSNLHQNFLMNTKKLKQFSMNNNRELFSSDGEIPNNFFKWTPELEVMNLFRTAISKFPMGTFDGLTKLKLMSFAQNGVITTDSFAKPYSQLFKDLTSLQFFDFLNNPIDMIPEGFFGEWASNILRLTFFGCPIASIHEKAGLENLISIEMAYFHTVVSNGTRIGGTFDQDLVRVQDTLLGINPSVTFTYGLLTTA